MQWVELKDIIPVPLACRHSSPGGADVCTLKRASVGGFAVCCDSFSLCLFPELVQLQADAWPLVVIGLFCLFFKPLFPDCCVPIIPQAFPRYLSVISSEMQKREGEGGLPVFELGRGK